MREQELWGLMERALGPAYASVWADTVVLAELGGRTVNAALAAGAAYKTVWLAVAEQLELPKSAR